MSRQPEKRQDEQALRPELERLRGTDPIVDTMLRHNIPLTREHYLDMAFLGRDPDDLDAEEEEDIPEPFQRKD